jgi:hypothetical protein
MTIKIWQHLMPWELDYSLLHLLQLKKASQYLLPGDTIHFDIALNLSSYIIDWEKSKLPKQFFIDKFEVLCKQIDWTDKVRPYIYDEDKLWGHLDFQRDVTVEPNIDYYIVTCPDMWFHEHLLYYLIEYAKKIKSKYFMIAPETHKLWDKTWDELVNKNYKDIPYSEWNKSNIIDIQNTINKSDEPFLKKANNFKWAGWFDLYSKDFVEELIPTFEDWKGYGPIDFFSMIVSDIATQNGAIVEEYILQNQIVCEYHPNKEGYNFSDYYKNLLVLNKIENQRQTIESKFPYYIEQWIQYAKTKKIF